MTANSKTLDIIKKLGDATPPPIHLSRLLHSPIQSNFSFAVSSDERGIAVRIFELLGEASVNLRFVSEYTGAGGEARIQFCCDADAQQIVLEVFKKMGAFAVLREFRHLHAVVVLSLYPFNGQPQIAGRVFAVLRQRGIEILCANTATSVFSFVVSADDLEPAVSSLKQVFIWQ